MSLLLFLHGAVASAQDEWDDAADGILSLYSSVGRLLTIVMMLGALIVLGMIIFNVMKGEREAAVKLAWWLLGLAFGLVMMSFLMY